MFHYFFVAIISIVLLGCGEDSTKPILTTRETRDSDDSEVALFVAKAFSKFMVAVEDHKSHFGINGGVDYNVFRPIEWRSQTTPAPGLGILWTNLYYYRTIQNTDLQILRFDNAIPSSTPFRPARLEHGLYRYGQLSIVVNSPAIPDSMRNFPIAYDIIEFDMRYEGDPNNPTTFQGVGDLSGVVNVRIDFSSPQGRGSIQQSDTIRTHVVFNQVGIRQGDFSGNVTFTGMYPYYNPLTDVRSFSRKRMDVTISVDSRGRGTGTIWMNGEERVRLFFNGRPYYYTGTYTVRANGFSREYPIVIQ
ncbi:MAG: hypothetical protein N2450_05110 [bacterium]|nr:hypothetical protein [bacterium]